MKIAFYKGRKRLSSRLISWWLRGPYSHCELVLSTNEHGISLCASASYLDGGVRMKTIEIDPALWDVQPVAGDADRALAWLRAHSGQRYDVLGLLGFVWRRQTGSARRWFCSEAVSAMLGWPDPWRIDPMALWSAVAGQTVSNSAVKGSP